MPTVADMTLAVEEINAIPAGGTEGSQERKGQGTIRTGKGI